MYDGIFSFSAQSDLVRQFNVMNKDKSKMKLKYLEVEKLHYLSKNSSTYVDINNTDISDL